MSLACVNRRFALKDKKLRTLQLLHPTKIEASRSCCGNYSPVWKTVYETMVCTVMLCFVDVSGN